MNKFRILLIASMAVLMAACATAPQKAAGPIVSAEANLAGSWLLIVESQVGTQDSTLKLQQTGKDLSGTLENSLGSVMTQGTVDGDNVKLWFSIIFQGTDLKIDLVGTQENGVNMKGRAIFGTYGEGTFSAKKQ